MDKLVIGILQAPYGLKGELKVKSLSGESGHFLDLAGSAVTLRPVVDGVGRGDGEERVVESARVVEPHLVIKFKGFDSPEKARALTNCEILVERDRAAPLAEDEYYIGELIGCQLVYQGAGIGVIRSVWDSGASEMLEVRVNDPAEASGWRQVQIPFRAQFIGKVDIAAKQVELLVDWILE